MSRLSRIRRALVYLVAVLGFGLLAALIVVQTDWFKEWLRGLAVRQTRSLLNGQLEITRLGGSLFRGVELEGVRLTQDGEVVLSSDRVVVRYDPWRLLRREWVFDTVRLEHPVIRATQTAAGWNLAHLTRSTGKTSAGLTIEFPEIEIVNGDVTIAPLEMTVRRLQEIQARLSFANTRDGAVIRIGAFAGVDSITGLRVAKLAGGFRANLTDLALEFDASVPGAMTIAGRVTGEARAGGRGYAGDVTMVDADIEHLLQGTGLLPASLALNTRITGQATFDTDMPPAGGAVRTSFTFAGASAAAFGYEVADVTAAGTAAAGAVDVDVKGRAYGAGADVHVAWRGATSKARPARIDVSGTVSRVDLRRLPVALKVPSLATSLAGRVRFSLAGSDWDADATLAESMVEGAVVAPGLVARASSSRRLLRYAAGGEIAGLDLRRLSRPLSLPVLDDARLDGLVGGRFYVFGRGLDVATRVLVAGGDLASTQFSGTSLDGTHLSVTLAGTRLAADVHAAFDGLTPRVSGASASTVDFALNGRADGAVVIDDIGAPIVIEKVQADAEVTLGPSTIDGTAVTDARVRATLDAGVATVAEFSAGTPGVRASASGALALGPTGTSDLAIAADIDDAAPIGAKLGQPISGAGRLAARITGPADHQKAEGVLTARSLTFGEDVSALTLRTEFSAEVRDREFAAAVVDASTETSFVELGGLDLVRATARTKYANKRMEVEGRLEQTTRAVDVAGALLFEPEMREVQIRRLALGTGGASWSLPENGTATARLAGDVVTVEGLALVQGAQRIDAAGRIALKASSREQILDGFRVTLTDVQVAEINRLLLGTQRLEGTINGTAHMTGDVADPHVDADLRVMSGRVADVPFESLSGTVAYEDRLARVNVALQESAANRLTVSGVVPTTSEAGPDRLDLTVSASDVGLGLIQALTGEIEGVTGTAQIDLRVGGTFASPDVTGTVGLSKGGFRVEATGVRYQDLNARMRFLGPRLNIETWQMADEDGHLLTITGGVEGLTEAKTRAFDLTIAARRLHVLKNGLGDVQVSADLRASGAFASPRIEGKASVDDGRLEVDQILERTTRTAYATEATDLAAAPAASATPGAPSGSLFARTAVDIDLTLPDNVVLRGRDMRVANQGMGLGNMNMIVGGSLALDKAAGGNIVVAGAVEVVRGYYEFQGRRFEVARGSGVQFRGTEPINPVLNFSANREISGIRTTVGVRGTVNRPTLELTSQPPLDEGDILSLIVFNAPINDLGESQRTSLANRAGDMAAAALAAPIANSVARALNLDQFEIQAASSGDTAPSVTLGSQIGTRVFLGVRQEFGKGDASTVSFEYRFYDALRLVTSVAQGTTVTAAGRRPATSGADLIFVIRY